MAETSTTPDAAQLIKAHQAGVWRYLRALGCEASLADDLTQETFLSVLERPFHHYHPQATAAYLRKVARNLFISRKRRSGRVVQVEDLQDFDALWTDWAGDDGGDAVLEALKDCLQTLGDRARLALDLRYREHASRNRIAQALDLSEHGAKNLMQRAKKHLRSCIERRIT